MPLQLTRSIYDAVVSTKCRYSTLQFVSGGDGVQIYEDDTVTCEIGFSKKTWLAIFTEGHQYFELHPFGLQEVSSMSNDELDSFYMATNCLLITTNEYSTIWRLHEQAVGEIYRRSHGNNAEKTSKNLNITILSREFTFCLGLCTSRLDRVNKSSSLWMWIRKLSAALIFQFESFSVLDVAEHVLRSMDLHFANYCASYTLLWLMDVGAELGVVKTSEEEQIAQLLRERCRGSLNDVSLWRLLGAVLGGIHSQYSLHHYNQVCTHMSTVLGQLMQALPQREVIPLHQKRISGQLFPDGIDDLQWLLVVECTVDTPYQCVLRSVKDTDRALQLIHATLDLIVAQKSVAESGSLFQQRLSTLLNQFGQ